MTLQQSQPLEKKIKLAAELLIITFNPLITSTAFLGVSLTIGRKYTINHCFYIVALVRRMAV
jgi:hypothetical protein